LPLPSSVLQAPLWVLLLGLHLLPSLLHALARLAVLLPPGPLQVLALPAGLGSLAGPMAVTRMLLALLMLALVAMLKMATPVAVQLPVVWLVVPEAVQ